MYNAQCFVELLLCSVIWFLFKNGSVVKITAEEFLELVMCSCLHYFCSVEEGIQPQTQSMVSTCLCDNCDNGIYADADEHVMIRIL